jgi:hypothetical protein
MRLRRRADRDLRHDRLPRHSTLISVPPIAKYAGDLKGALLKPSTVDRPASTLFSG